MLKFSADPQLEAKVRDFAGLYLNPPDKAVVLCLDEISQAQALNRIAPILPLRPGIPERQTHDYVRRGHNMLLASGGRDREGRRRLLSPALARGVPALPPPGRPGLPPQAAAHRRG